MRIAIVLSKILSNWTSCQVITPNLLKLYHDTFPDDVIHEFDYSNSTNQYEYFHLIEGLKSFRPDKIIFLDHQPHPKRILNDLDEDLDYRPKIYIHLYGDFSLFTDDWISLEGILKLYPVKLIAASDKQVNFVNQFVNSDTVEVEKLCFPVDENKFYYDPEIRKSAIEELNIQGTKSYLYTGRLSSQKNIIQLCKVFAKFLTVSNSNSHLYIAGEFDDLGQPFFGNHYPIGLNYHKFISYINSLSEKHKERIHFVGNLPQKELLKYYHACDVFLSISLHHDEDYGMSPAEAMVCGMPMILSDWGGYSSFATTDYVKTLAIESEKSYYKVSSKSLLKAILNFQTMSFNNESRTLQSEQAKKQLTINGNIQVLKSIHEKDIQNFPGWNKKFTIFSSCFQLSPQTPFIYQTGEVEDNENSILQVYKTKKIYRECYHEYACASQNQV